MQHTPQAWLQDMHALWQRRGPACTPLWPQSLQAAWPAKPHLLERWPGEGAAFARYSSAAGPLFLKYLPAGTTDKRAFRRFARERQYLQDLAPSCPVSHAPLLHAEQDERRLKAHLLLADLTKQTYGWGHFKTEAEQEAALHDLMRLMAQFHAFWAGPGAKQIGKVGLESLRVPEPWPEAPQDVREALTRLPNWLERAQTRSLVHGDLHAGQVLWPRLGGAPYLIDYGQLHFSLPGEDLAHVLYTRLEPEKRLALGEALRQTYRQSLSEHGLDWSDQELGLQERAGLAINLISVARQWRRRRSEGVRQALERVQQAWRE